CYVWFGLTEVAAITAVAINKIPNFAVTMREGTRSLSKDLAEMAEVYRFGRWRTLRHVILPQLAPFFMAAVRSGLALVWKIVLVVELLGRSNGVGYQLNVAFQLFDVSLILAYAIAFILVVQMIEVGILQPLEVRAGRWRRCTTPSCSGSTARPSRRPAGAGRCRLSRILRCRFRPAPSLQSQAHPAAARPRCSTSWRGSIAISKEGWLSPPANRTSPTFSKRPVCCPGVQCQRTWRWRCRPAIRGWRGFRSCSYVLD